ncbi:MAG TPA: hypothetical protein VJ826_04790, partial [Candidatus Polarisedimenticolaceae bacterium]|nr:hypothetical protein [Candidatus Polarisedimenticolaceae bacterium]
MALLRRGAVGALACLFATAVPASEPHYLLRFELDNDVFLNKDSSFTAGGSLQVHAPPRDVWSRANAAWIGRVPGLGDDGEG